MSAGFLWRDGGRTVVCEPGLLGRAAAALGEYGFEGFELLSTPRALAEAERLCTVAAGVHEVGPGQVPDLAADLVDRLGQGPLVALGGGRVIDVAKALASLGDRPVAAIPTTMSGAEMTAIHRLPAGAERRVRAAVRPGLVLADPELMTSQSEPRLRASSMNALAHGADSIYTPLANPMAELAAMRGAESIAAALDQPASGRDRPLLALGSLLCGYAIDSAGLGLHHVVCQALVRVCDSPHAETNAAVLPRALAFLAPRAPGPFALLASRLGTDVEHLEARTLELGGSPEGLGALGAEPAMLDDAVAAMLRRPELAFVPGPAITAEDLRALIDAAWGNPAGSPV